MRNLEFHPIDLPGRRAYPAQISVRQFGKDEVAGYDRLRRLGNEASLRALISGTVQGYSVEELYEPDFLHIMMWHRVNSFLNFPMKLPWDCPTCESRNEDKLDLGQVIAEELPEDYDVGGNVLDMPCGIPMILRLSKVGDESRARQMLNALQVQNISDELVRRAEICQMMEYDENYNTLEKWEIVNHALTVEDMFAIDGFRRIFAFGPSNRMRCNCKRCGGQQNVGFRFSILEFLPSDYDSGSIRTRILSARPSRDAARRAKDAVIPKASSIPTPTFEKTGGLGQRAAANPGQPGGGPSPNQAVRPAMRDGDGQPLDFGPDNDDALIRAAMASGALPPNFKPQQNLKPPPGPRPDVTQVEGLGTPGTPVTPAMSSNLTGRLLEETRHEAQENSPPQTAGSVVNRDR